MVLRNPDEITNKDVKKLLRKHAFYEEVNTLSKILRPIKTAITMVEGEQTNLADAFIQMIRLAYTLKNTVTIGLNQFRRHAIQAFNKRWGEFDISAYLLAYFLHPAYRGKYICFVIITAISIIYYIIHNRCRNKKRKLYKNIKHSRRNMEKPW